MRDFADGFGIEQAVGCLVDGDGRLPERFCDSATLDCGGRPQVSALALATVLEEWSIVNIFELDVLLQDPERGFHEFMDRPLYLDQDAVMGRVGLAVGDAGMGEPEFKSEQQLVEFGQRRVLPSQRCAGEQDEPVAASFELPPFSSGQSFRA